MLTQKDRSAVAAVGLAIARGVLAEHLGRQHTSLDPQDTDQLAARGLKPASDEWHESEAITKEARLADIRADLDKPRVETED